MPSPSPHTPPARPSSPHIPALDGLRGAAILLVLGSHLGGGRQSSHLLVRFIGDTLRIGWAGVSLFFVLSGFLITGILWDTFSLPGWWKRFYRRRSLRIFPLYYLALLYCLVVALCVARSALPALWAYAFYLQDFPWSDRLTGLVPQNWFVLSHFWSLAVEEQFYLIWPLILYSLRHRRRLALQLALAVMVASFALRVFLLHQTGNWLWAYHALPSRCGELLLGAWVALSLRGSPEERSILDRYALPVCAASFTAIIGISIYTRFSLEIVEPAWLGLGLFVIPIFFAALLVLCLRPGPVERLFTNPMLIWYGQISYGVYVFHALLSPMFVRMVDGLKLPLSSTSHDLLQAIVDLVGSTIVALISFHTVEAYFRSLKERPTAKMPASGQQSGS